MPFLLCIYFFAILDFSMTKKRSSENLEDRTKFFRESLEKTFFGGRAAAN